MKLLWYISLTVILSNAITSEYNGWGWNYPSSSKQIKDGSCELTLTSLNTTKYNLCPLKLLPLSQIPYYNVYDIRLNKSFAFNILSPTLQTPSINCPTDDDNSNSNAYLYNNQECISLSFKTPVISLLNDHNPSQGIVLSYQQSDPGSSSSSSVCGNHGKRLNLRFICDNEALVDIPNTIISEIDYYGDNADNIDNQCQYNLTFNSVYGCPHSCPVYNKKVCNNYGLCGYDATFKHEPSCYCYSTIGGIACEIDPEDNNVYTPSTETTGIGYNLSLATTHQFVWNKTSYNGDIYQMNVTFDLKMFTNIWRIKDLDGTQYDYYFAKVPDKYIEICGNKTRNGVIFQIDEVHNECIIAGGWDINWKLYDLSNPVKGVSLSFGNGDICDKNGDKRQFKVNFICPDDINTYFVPNQTIETFVEEDDYKSCDYHMDIVSAYACPKECITPISDNIDDGINICSTHGMCIADIFSGYVHCQCDGPPHIEWSDEYCTNGQDNGPPDSGDDGNDGNNGTNGDDNTGYQVALVIVSGILLLFCGLSGYLFYRQRKQILELNTSNIINYEKPMLDEVNQIIDDDIDSSNNDKKIIPK